MGVERLRNVKTGEVREVETNSDEYQNLLNEIYDHDGSARPKWEITGSHHVRRLDEGDVAEEDLGYEHKPIPGALVDVTEVGPEQHPERALTQGEVDAGIDSHEAKLEGLPSVLRTGNPAIRNAEPLERSDPEEREERGRELAGSASGKQSKAGSRRSSKSSAGTGSSSSGAEGASTEGSKSSALPGVGSGSSGGSAA